MDQKSPKRNVWGRFQTRNHVDIIDFQSAEIYNKNSESVSLFRVSEVTGCHRTAFSEHGIKIAGRAKSTLQSNVTDPAVRLCQHHLRLFHPKICDIFIETMPTSLIKKALK